MNFQGGSNNSRNFHGPGGNSSLLRGPSNNNGALFNNVQNRVNPWEAGFTPAGVGNRSSGGLLPTPNIPAGPGLLQQPGTGTLQNVQLAVANNVLSLLLPNMQQPQRHNQPLLGCPNRGLLSLNPNIGGQGQGPNPNFGQSPMGLRPNIGPNHGGPNRRSDAYTKMHYRNREGQTDDGRKSNFSRHTGHPGANPRNNNERKPNARCESKIAGAVNQDKWKKEINDEDIEKEALAYADIHVDFFYCHICSCKLSGSLEFARHLKGKNHQSKFNQCEEKYRKETEKMREEMKVEETQNQIKEVRMRNGKPIPKSFREHCTMCNLHFFGNLIAHRKSNRHQQLKSFLHPNCELCDKEFSSRIDYDYHLLSAVHLSALNDQKQQLSTHVKKKDIPLQTEEEKKPSTQNNKKTDIPQVEEKTVDHPKKSPSTIANPSIPNFDPSKEIGMEFLEEKTGYLCKCCNRFLSSSADAKTHCRSRFHFDKYVAHMSMKDNQPVKQLLKQNESQCNKVEPEPKEVKKHCLNDDEDDEGNWKRRRIVKDDDDDTKANANQKMDSKGIEKLAPEKNEDKLTTNVTDKAEPDNMDEDDLYDLEKTLLIEGPA
ncbi:zinc finger protein on ecdysone puffs [Frankliniella occidentalis]|uniref:Zinc finger protein on ecdysone puffs n=1 Tax=Frankliniella occidentalis TaxID=133901 RepID=A0A9C6U2A9_FRAOC|nr:zinc finger protein on ecdysone puffs [Frankliniella occidentalis]